MPLCFSQQHGLFVEKKSITSHLKMGTPERKILIAFCFYVLLMTVSIPSFMLGARLSKLFAKHLNIYFVCEQQGVDPSNPGRCDEFRDAFRMFDYPELSTMAYVLNNLFPIVFIIYSVNFQELKAKFMKFRAKKKRVDFQSNNEMRTTEVATSISTLETLKA